MRIHGQWVQAEMRKTTGRTSVKLRIRIRGDRLNQTLRFPKCHIPVFTYGGLRRGTVNLYWKLFFRTKVPQIIISRSHHNAVRYFICPASRHPVFRPPDRTCGLEASPQFIGNRSRNVLLLLLTIGMLASAARNGPHPWHGLSPRGADSGKK